MDLQTTNAWLLRGPGSRTGCERY